MMEKGTKGENPAEGSMEDSMEDFFMEDLKKD